jgi:pSer/pThr/pTyr-binding forkhead associated (FHA) protein
VIQLQVLSGKEAGANIHVRHFPFVIGRATDANARFSDPGVWDRHCEIDFYREEGFQYRAQPDATVLVNGERMESGILRNGDLLELGSVRLRFWLARSRQKGLRFREGLTWAALATLFVVQGTIIWWLLR